MPKDWSLRATLPEHLDVTQADVYTEKESKLGGRMLAWGDEIWWQRPDGRYQRAIHKIGDLNDRLWVKG